MKSNCKQTHTLATFFKALGLITASVFLSTSLYAQAASDPVPPAESKAAIPLEEVVVPFPPELRINGNEGWVQLSYIIDKEGNVTDPIIEASIGGPAFEKTAKEALSNLKYSPAVYKGSPVTQAVSGEVVEFLLDQTFEGVDQGFSNAYTELITLYQQGNYAEADAGLAKLSLGQDLTIQELGMLEILYAHSAAQRGESLKQLQHLRNASVRGGMYLPKDMLVSVLQSRFVLAAKYSLFQEAFASYALLEQIDPLNDKLTSLAMMVAPMQKAIESGQLIQVTGVIGSHGHWTYMPMRSIFAFHTADEGVKEIEPRCERKSQHFPVNTENEWKIPKTWGDCSIVVYGTPGAKFELLEYNDET